MAAVEILDRNRRPDIARDQAETRLALEVESILEAAGQPQEEERPETRQWSYRVPFAGVRYYSFQTTG